ncbi:MAG TPA: hypothetical protein PK189_05910, partial [bacterium]|nr:hypothetical protein [bacterium]
MKTNLILIFLIIFGSLIFAGQMQMANSFDNEFDMKMCDYLAFKNEDFGPDGPHFDRKQSGKFEDSNERPFYGKNNKGFKKGRGLGFDKEVEEKILEECKSKYPEFHKFLLSIKEKDE